MKPNRRPAAPAAPLLAVLAVLVTLGGCDRIDEIGFSARGPAESAHAAYAKRLEEAGLAGTALGRDWIEAGRRALLAPGEAAAPFQESGYFAPDRPEALGYRLTLQRGQRLIIDAVLAPDSAALLFLDIYELPADTAAPPRLIATADSAVRGLEFEPRRAGEYLLRIQPELLRGGRYDVTVRPEAALAFPVSGAGSSAVGSRFGAERDGGRRQHHGIDIFAPRGTPVIATSVATVTRVNETPIGGKVVWLRDVERNASIYYAHLDSQYVATGARLQAGDTLGTVGNTGNARTTPPHLHFGIYARGEGPVDPYPWVHVPHRTPAALAVDTTRFDRWVRVSAATGMVRGGPGADSAPRLELPRHSALYVSGGSAGWYRVRAPDGATGYIAASAVQPAEAPLERLAANEAAVLRDAPRSSAAAVDSVRAGTTVAVLGRFNGFALVRNGDGRATWLELSGP